MAFGAIRVTRAAIVATPLKTSHTNTRLMGFKQSAASSKRLRSLPAKLLAQSPRPGPPPPPPLFHADVIQSDCSLVYLSAGWFSLFYTLTDDAWERAEPSGKHGVSQLCSPGCQVSPGCRRRHRHRRSPPLLTGEVKEIKRNIPGLILPNAL